MTRKCRSSQTTRSFQSNRFVIATYMLTLSSRAPESTAVNKQSHSQESQSQLRTSFSLTSSLVRTRNAISKGTARTSALWSYLSESNRRGRWTWTSQMTTTTLCRVSDQLIWFLLSKYLWSCPSGSEVTFSLTSSKQDQKKEASAITNAIPWSLERSKGQPQRTRFQKRPCKRSKQITSFSRKRCENW